MRGIHLGRNKNDIDHPKQRITQGGGFEDRNGEQCGYVYVNVHFGVEEGDGIENFTEIERQS